MDRIFNRFWHLRVSSICIYPLPSSPPPTKQVNGRDVSSKEDAETLFSENKNAVTLLVSRSLYTVSQWYWYHTHRRVLLTAVKVFLFSSSMFDICKRLCLLGSISKWNMVVLRCSLGFCLHSARSFSLFWSLFLDVRKRHRPRLISWMEQIFVLFSRFPINHQASLSEWP